MKELICKQGASNYYLVNDGMGGFLNPPGHPEHAYSIQEFSKGHEVGSYSLSAAMSESWMPSKVQIKAKWILKRWNAGAPDEAWLATVYNYFRHCYSKDGNNRNVNDCVTYGKFWDNAEQEENEDPTHHLGYLFVKQFYPDHKPDMGRIKNNDSRGQWSK